MKEPLIRAAGIRTAGQKIIDTALFPIRCLTGFGCVDRFGLSSLATDRWDYVSRLVRGYCLDVGCSRYNRFITKILKGNGKGIDVYPYEGLTEENVVPDLSHFPFNDGTFASVTFIANFNHIPVPLRPVETAEAFRVLKPGGNIIITMPSWLASVVAHQVIGILDRIFGTKNDIDTERGMAEDETYYVSDEDIRRLLAAAGFRNIRKQQFLTQWGMNHLFVADK